MDKSSGAPKGTVTKETKDVTKEPVKKMTKEVKKESDSWIRPTPISLSALWSNAKQPSCDKSASEEQKKHKYESCNHTWVVRSHPTIPYSGAFCSKCDIEN